MKINRYGGCVLFIPFFALQPIVLQAQNKPPGTNPDAEFVQHASANGLGEVRLCQLATQNATSNAIKDFAKRLVADHTKANDDLKVIASEEKLKVAAQPGIKDNSVYDALSTLPGTALDGAFISAMVTDHREDIATFEKEVQTGTNAKVKDFATQTLPVLKEHLKQAEKTAADLGLTITATGGR